MISLEALIDKLRKLEEKAIRTPYSVNHLSELLCNMNGKEMSFGKLDCSEFTQEYILESANLLPTLLAIVEAQGKALRLYADADENSPHKPQEAREAIKETEKLAGGTQ